MSNMDTHQLNTYFNKSYLFLNFFFLDIYKNIAWSLLSYIFTAINKVKGKLSKKERQESFKSHFKEIIIIIIICIDRSIHFILN